MLKGTKHSIKSKQIISQKIHKAWHEKRLTKKTNACFEKGHKPWNKNLKGIHLNPDTEFTKKMFKNITKHPSWLGGIQIMKNDCIYLWDKFNPKKRIRRPKKIIKDANIKIPNGYVIFHKDGNKYNDSLENLEVISRAELLKKNREKNL